MQYRIVADPRAKITTSVTWFEENCEYSITVSTPPWCEKSTVFAPPHELTTTKNAEKVGAVLEQQEFILIADPIP
jgi:hypothetical protein